MSDLETALGYALACHFSGDRMPHMSGDPRNRLSPGRRRAMDDAIVSVIDALGIPVSVLASLRPGPNGEPPTHVVVPRKPTEAMIAAGWIDKEDVDPADIWHAMLAAAQEPRSMKS